MVSCGISTTFAVLSPNRGKVTHALLTRPPLKHIPSRPKPFQNMSPLDLHVLGTPPAFVLSQDQTLTFNPFSLSQLLGLAPLLSLRPSLKKSRKSLSFGIICLFLRSFLFLYRFQGSLPAQVLARRSLYIIANIRQFVNTFFKISSRIFALLKFPNNQFVSFLIRSFASQY